jgi:hypothetical protein
MMVFLSVGQQVHAKRTIADVSSSSGKKASDYRCQAASRLICNDGSEQPDDGAALAPDRGIVQAPDSCDQLRVQRNGRLQNHAPLRMRRRQRAAVEAKPRDRIDELALAVDEIGDPQRPIPQEDRHFAPLVLAQQLALK